MKRPWCTRDESSLEQQFHKSDQGRIQGGSLGSRDPLQTVLILKQVLQIIILIGAKAIII